MVDEQKLAEGVKQGNVEGWYVIEMMGHRQEIGYVRTEAYGAAVLFRVDTPGLEEGREYTLESPEYAVHEGSKRWCLKGTKVRRNARPAKSVLVGPNSIYAMNPVTEQAAIRLIERNFTPPLIALEIPIETAALPPVSEYDEGEGDGF